VIESRLVCGLSLIPVSRRDPLGTTSKGVGELVTQLSGAGARTVLVGLGGSATVDGGTGMARAWGFVPLDASGRELAEGGGGLADLARFEGGQAPAVRLVGLVDVRNPLTGDRGARVYSAQKGAGKDAVERLARGLERLATVSGRPDLADAPMAGAAGGLGFGILFFGQGTLVGGAGWFLERLGLSDHLKGARLVVTGEGAFDATSLEGKLTGEVLTAARRAGVPAALLAPRADHVPAGVLVESGGEQWNAGELARRAQALVERALRAGATG
jgi:glycerate kinase